MYFYKDNFLPSELFDSLNKRMLWRFKPELRQDTKADSVYYSHGAVRIRTTLCENNDFTEAAVLLGRMVPDAINAIKDYVVESYNFKNPLARSIWFQYQNTRQYVGKHLDDGNIRGKQPQQCFSTFLYAHDRWEDDWGGELCMHSGEVLPKSNRLVVYSRDEEHWVNPINHGMDDYQRMFLGVSWSTDNDF